MSTVQTLESLQESLDPLEVLQSDQVEMGAWIHDSFAALEKLHAELTQWQSELARKETELDLRQDALGKADTTDKGLRTQNTELEARFTQLRAEYEALDQRNTELEINLEAERERSSHSDELIKEGFERLHSDFENYYELLAGQLEKIDSTTHDMIHGHDPYTPLSAGAAHAKSAELRRRAQSRRQANVRKDHKRDN